MPPGPAWIDLLREAWHAGIAVLPIDHRLPAAETDRLLRIARPAAVLARDAVEPAIRRGGVPVPEDVRLVVATSGTAAAPKLAELTGSGIEAALDASNRRLGARADAPWFSCLPVAHMGGMLVALRGALLGTPVALEPSFDAATFARREVDPRYTSLVPTMLRRVLEGAAPLAGFDAILVGGAALPRELAARASADGSRVVSTYGLTETCGGVVYDREPLDGVEVRIGASDEILLRGPTVMRGYRSDPDATAASFDTDGWLRTGDAGTIDAAGRLRVAGRLDDLIVTGGEKVWPEEVEAVLMAAPQVAEAAVVGVDDPEWGQRVVAFVVPSDPGDPPSTATVRAIAGGRLARAKVPREIVLVERLPRTRSGKVRRSALLRPGGPGAHRGTRPPVPHG